MHIRFADDPFDTPGHTDEWPDAFAQEKFTRRDLFMSQYLWLWYTTGTTPQPAVL
eukprot:CAMPEP_0198225886 /NCGR_PEP_ID=MMETSP1445-20131203/102944_1 /TAXON_ID=36898 /ORGANISM="Pyramimonas sp., Strain CCMP2087" /LENGTH=54 /DNA_ID=CAMNT_0043905549 /DNA_START=1 /DNA_END=162 /DNA_ORIENTATION=+